MLLALSREMATKEDIENLRKATKDDVEKLRKLTREDVENPGGELKSYINTRK
jgi:hypothetical protein